VTSTRAAAEPAANWLVSRASVAWAGLTTVQRHGLGQPVVDSKPGFWKALPPVGGGGGGGTEPYAIRFTLRASTER